MPNKNAPLKTPAPSTVYNSDSGASHMDIEPIDPRQGQVIDNTIPHAMDTILPDPIKPGMPPVSISPGEIPDPNLRPILPTARPDDIKRPGFSGLSRT